MRVTRHASFISFDDTMSLVVLLLFLLFDLLQLFSSIKFCDAFQIYGQVFLFSAERAKTKIINKISLVSLKREIRVPSKFAFADASASRTSEPALTTAPHITNFDKFDYNSHWYPVIWERDLVPDRPTKVTLFDVDYVIAKTSRTSSSSSPGEGGEIMALVDACPHKSAALSEGRITSCGSFQCAYHGWTFHGSTGQCLSIPQVGETSANRLRGNTNNVTTTTTDRTNARAIPAQSVQGMVFIFPAGRNLVHQHPPPPRIPELDNYETRTHSNSDYRLLGPIIRDFPIDWTILVENIMDPDHGVFAHQASGFDFYTASKEHAQVILQDTPLNQGKGWTITSSVDAVYKVLARRHHPQNKADSTSSSSSSYRRTPFQATTRYVAPSMIWMGRINSETNQTLFFNVFYVTPTGTGKSRFMAASYAKLSKFLPLPPRWVTQMAVNNFLDQDTQLLATQQRHVLAVESQLALEAEQNMTNTNGATSRDLLYLPVRKTLYTYRSPSERLGVRLGAFFDATVHRIPNRIAAIRSLGGYDRVLHQAVPPRDIVLDRYRQHTMICPDSMTFLNYCHKVRQLFLYVALVPILIPLLLLPTMLTASNTTTINTRISLLLSAIQRVYIKYPGLPIAISLTSALISHLAKKLSREFVFKYDSSFRNRDLDKIPKLKPDS